MILRWLPGDSGSRIWLLGWLVLDAGAFAGRPAAAQTPSPPQPSSAVGLLGRPARLDIDHLTLDRALIELSQRSGVLISFSPSLVPQDVTVTCRCRSLTVGEALERLLARTALRFGELESQVLIFPKRPSSVDSLSTVAARAPADGSTASRPKPAPRFVAARSDSLDAGAGVELAGTVVDQSTGRAIEGARIQLLGTDRRTESTRMGAFSLPRVPPGPRLLRVRAVGYHPMEQLVDDSVSSRVELSLSAMPYPLAEIVSTATGDRNTLELGNAVSRLAVSDLIASGSVTSLQDVLTGRMAGVAVLADNGVLGAGGRIRVRGQSSASLSNDPLIYVDGIRVEGSSPALYGTPGVGGARPSFLNYLDPNEIESIEVVKGPSAATLYGTQAANGVIRIVTKRGSAGPTRWAVSVEQGVTRDPTRYPDAYFSAGHDPNTGAARACLPYQQARGECFVDRVYRRNLMEDAAYTLLKSGYRQAYGVQVSGGTDRARFFLSTDFENQSGTLKMPAQQVLFLKQERATSTIPDGQLDPSGLSRTNLRGNFSLALSDRADLTFSTGLIHGKTRFAPGGDDVSNPLVSAVIGANADPNAASPYGFVPPNQGLARMVSRTTDRLTNSVQAHWRPHRILEARGTVGLDYVTTDDAAATEPGQGCVVCELDRQGLRAIDHYVNHKYSVDLGLTASFDFARRVASRSSIGAQYHRDGLVATFDRANGFPPGGATIDAGTIRSSSEAIVASVTLGTYVEEQVSLDQRLFLTGAVRIDRNSAFGAGFRSATYPKASLSWIVRDGVPAGFANTIRVRAAFGASGLQPPANAAIPYFSPVGATLAGANVPAVTLGGLGNPALRPERSKELELGVDGEFLDSRASVGLTYYSKRTTDALINRELPPSLGATATRVENLGTVSNQGIELTIRGRPLDHPGLRWDLEVQVSANRNRLESLGPGVPPIRGFGFTQFPGYPLFGLWLPRLESFRDRNGDGIIEPDEIVVSDTAEYGGSSIPTRSISLSGSVAVLDRKVRLSWLIDYQGGRVGDDVEELFRCSLLQICQAINDPAAPLEAQAKAVAGAVARGAWIEDASFIKLREVGLVIELPRSWARVLRSRSATVSITGRNLALKKFGWSSWDPELNTTSSDGPSFTHSDQTPPRMLLFRLSLR